MTDGKAYEVTDRRPIAARRLAVMNRLAAWLVGVHISANSISVAGMVCGLLAGACLWWTASAGTAPCRILFLAAAVLIQMRLLANLLDGMVAVGSGTASRVGELFNEIPDRVSDTAGLTGLGYALGGLPWLGWFAALLAVLTAYMRTLGKASGTGSDFRGPMAKQQRMFLVTVTSVFRAIAPFHVLPLAAEYCLWIICAGCVITIVRRLAGIAIALRRAA